MSARPGEEYVIMRDAFMQPAFFLAGNRARNRVAVLAFKNMFTSTTSLHKDFVTVVLSF